MTNHAHKHEHCKHERMKFCQHCNTPYCLDCGEEWNKERISYQPYPVYTQPIYQLPIYQPSYVWPKIICDGTAVPTVSSGLVAASNTVLLTECSHSAS